MSIDAVIARARRPGNFSERRRFTIARTEAIQKLRQFALADPHAYVLELIQSAIGNGAVSIDIQRGGGGMTLAYIGGGLPEAALTRLFDYLFAGKDRVDIGPYRDLAHGINALLALSPARIVVESGDGTKEGTTRLELERGADRFDVGRPDHALAGTYVRAEGLADDHGRERRIVEARCRLAPIPIVYDSEALFGHASRRIPSLPGFPRTITFDEGDLYGILGDALGAPGPTVALLTRGVVIEEIEHDLIPGRPIAGVINFDALHKSADHARVVRDDRMEEMWLRVRPYAHALTSGPDNTRRRADAIQAAPWGEGPLPGMPEIRAWLHAARRVVIAPPGTEPGSLAADVAHAIAEALSARVLLATADHVRPLRLIAGIGVDVHAPDLSTAVDLEFYAQAPAEPPPRPWVAQPIDVPAFPVVELAPHLLAVAAAASEAILHHLGDAAEIQARIYTPAAADDPTTAEVRLLAGGRLLHAARVPSRHAGHVLVAELPLVARSWIVAPARRLRGPSHADLLAAALLVHLDVHLADAATRALAGVGRRDGPLGVVEAHRVLDLLARTAVLQFRHRIDPDGASRPVLEFSLLEPGPPGVDLLDLPLLATAAGAPVSLRALAADLTARGGHIPADALRLDPASAPLVRAIVGDTALDPPPAVALDAAGNAHALDDLRAALAAGQAIVAGHARRIPRDAPRGDVVPGFVHVTPAGFLALAGDGLVSALDLDLDADAFIAAIAVRTPEVDGLLGVPRRAPAAPGVLVLDDDRTIVHRFVELAADFGVVGVLRLRAAPWTDERAAVVAAAIATATGDLYQRLLVRVPTLPPDSPDFARAAAAMLGYAGRRVALVADAHRRVRVLPVQATADRVLGLPLFPGRRGLPLPAWYLVRRFAAAGGDPSAALAELDAGALPPVLSDWLAAVLDPARIAASDGSHEPAARVPGHLELRRDGALEDLVAPPRDGPLDDVTLATTLEVWLHALRPDLPPATRPWDRRGRVRILLEGHEIVDEFAAVEGDAGTWLLTLRIDHWLVRWALRTARRDRAPIAWLLLACYARVNEFFDDVTNDHEGLFQRAVADALEQGRLDLVTPRFE